LKTIAYTCSYEQNENISSKQISEQIAEIKNFCKLHGIELCEIYNETSDRDDFKPTLLNIMSNIDSTTGRIIITSPEVISRNTDFRDWIFDEFERMKIEIIFTKISTENKDIYAENKLSNITENIKNIPSLPEIITKSIELMQDKNTSAETLSKIISNDIGLTARVLKLVNSAYYGFPKQISTIRQAITILGFTTIKGVILSASIFKMFSSKGNNIPFNYKEFWKHSMLVASASRMLSKLTYINSNEDIFAAAFLHDIGKIIFAQYDTANYAHVCKMTDLSDTDYMKEEEKYCGLNHCEIGNLVAYSWNLPEIFGDIITYHHAPQQSLNFENEVSVVFIANEIAKNIKSNKILNIDKITSEILEKLNISTDNIISVNEELKTISDNIEDIDSFFD